MRVIISTILILVFTSYIISAASFLDENFKQENNDQLFFNQKYLVYDFTTVKKDPKRIFFPATNEIIFFKLGLGGSYFGPTLELGLCYGKNHNLFTLRYLKGDEFRFNVEGHYNNPAKKVREFSFLYGRYYKDNNIILSLSGGMGILNGIYRGKNIGGYEHEQMQISTIGMSVVVQFAIFFQNYWGINISAFTNLNKKKILIGGMIGIHLGSYK